MNRTATVGAIIALPLLTFAQDLPMPSPLGTVEQVVGLTHIKITYSRPAAKGRVVFGDLVPWKELWRTGANKCTTIEFDMPLTVGGRTLDAGKYSLFTVPVPAPDSWEVIFNKNTDLWGKEGFKDEDVVLRAKATVGRCAPTESFTIAFDDVKNDSAKLEFSWEGTRVSLPVSSDCTGRAVKNIGQAVLDPKADFNTFNRCARFLADRKLKLNEAMGYAQKSVQLESHYWNEYTLARVYAAQGDYKSAVEQGRKALDLALADKDARATVKEIHLAIADWTLKMPPGK